MTKKKIGIIGCGNMGEAIIKGLRRLHWRSDYVAASETDAARRERIRKTHKLSVSADNKFLVMDSDVIILAVKPRDIEGVLRDVACCGVLGGKLVISIAAGVSTGYIENILGKGVAVVRAMPNLPATVAEAMTCISAGRWAASSHVATAREIFSAVGGVVEMKEILMDAATAVSGSGPAYFFYLMETMIEAARELGMSKKTATDLVVRTAVGSAKLVQELAEDPLALRMKVTSKGGTTEAAFRAIEAKKIKDGLKGAIKKAYARSKELSKERTCS